MIPGCAPLPVRPHLPHQLPLVWQQRLLERPGADAGGADGGDGRGAVGGVTRRLRCPPSTATAQCACGFGAKARAGTKKFVRRGGREFFCSAQRKYRAHFAPKPGHIALSPHLAGSLVVACLSLLWRERHCGLAFSNGGYLKRTGSLKTALYVDQTIFLKVPGFSLFLVDQTSQMKQERMIDFVVEVANLYDSGLRWTSRWISRK